MYHLCKWKETEERLTKLHSSQACERRAVEFDSCWMRGMTKQDNLYPDIIMYCAQGCWAETQCHWPPGHETNQSLVHIIHSRIILLLLLLTSILHIGKSSKLDFKNSEVVTANLALKKKKHKPLCGPFWTSDHVLQMSWSSFFTMQRKQPLDCDIQEACLTQMLGDKLPSRWADSKVFLTSLIYIPLSPSLPVG